MNPRWAVLIHPNCPFSSIPTGKAVTKKKYIGIRMMSLTSRWVRGEEGGWVRSASVCGFKVASGAPPQGSCCPRPFRLGCNLATSESRRNPSHLLLQPSRICEDRTRALLLSRTSALEGSPSEGSSKQQVARWALALGLPASHQPLLHVWKPSFQHEEGGSELAWQAHT